MNALSENLTAQQERTITALLAQPSIVAAAQAAKVSEPTVRRWLRQDDRFVNAYRDARRQVVEQAVARLQQASGEAVATLRLALTEGPMSVRVRAADTILSRAMQGVELLDIETRLASLEATTPQQR